MDLPRLVGDVSLRISGDGAEAHGAIGDLAIGFEMTGVEQNLAVSSAHLERDPHLAKLGQAGG